MIILKKIKNHRSKIWNQISWSGNLSGIHPPSGKTLKAFKDKVRNCTRLNTPVNLDKIIKDLNPILCGVVNYFKITNSRTRLEKTTDSAIGQLPTVGLKLLDC